MKKWAGVALDMTSRVDVDTAAFGALHIAAGGFAMSHRKISVSTIEAYLDQSS
jgi:hypothetical protein